MTLSEAVLNSPLKVKVVEVVSSPPLKVKLLEAVLNAPLKVLSPISLEPPQNIDFFRGRNYPPQNPS